MGKEACSAVAVPFLKRCPEVSRLLRKRLCPVLVSNADRFGRGAVVEARRLRTEGDALQVQLEAAIRAIVVEGLERHDMQGRDEGDVQPLTESLAQAKRAVGRQLRHQPVGDWREAFVLLQFGHRLVRDDFNSRRIEARHGGARCLVFCCIAVRLDRQFVLGTDIAALDTQAAIRCDADEGAGAFDLGPVEHDGSGLESLQRCFKLRQALVDLVGQVVGVLVFRGPAIELCLDSVARRFLLGSERRGLTAEQAQSEA